MHEQLQNELNRNQSIYNQPLLFTRGIDVHVPLQLQGNMNIMCFLLTKISHIYIFREGVNGCEQEFVNTASEIGLVTCISIYNASVHSQDD